MESHKHEEHKHTEHHVEHKPKEHSLKSDYRVYLIAALVVLVLFNQWQISSLTNLSPSSGGSLQSISDVIPKGIPLVYGAELGVSYDDISLTDQSKTQNTISNLGAYDRSIDLTGNDFQRYINVLYKLEGGISCEYCCGAKSVITADGRPACGCAHSYAMRGLTKYLIQKHPSEFTDNQILEELGKWKTLFFPGIIAQKAAILKEKGIELNYINLASNKYRGIEKGVESSGGMVGGC